MIQLILRPGHITSLPIHNKFHEYGWYEGWYVVFVVLPTLDDNNAHAFWL